MTNLTEDDTFRRLKRLPFHDVENCIAAVYIDPNKWSTMFNGTGWEPKEYLNKAHETYYSEQDSTNKSLFINYWLTKWGY